MSDLEFFELFGVTYEKAYKRLEAMRDDSNIKWLESIKKNSYSENEQRKLSYVVKAELKIEKNLAMLKGLGYEC